MGGRGRGTGCAGCRWCLQLCFLLAINRYVVAGNLLLALITFPTTAPPPLQSLQIHQRAGHFRERQPPARRGDGRQDVPRSPGEGGVDGKMYRVAQVRGAEMDGSDDRVAQLMSGRAGG